MSGRIINKGGEKRLPLPEVGRLHIGKKAISASGKEYPVSCDFFVPSTEGRLGKYAALFTEAYGEKPNTIQIVFPSDDPELCCKEEYEYRDTAGKKVASGDGVDFMVWSASKKEYVSVSAEKYPNVMQEVSARFPGGKWGVVLTLWFVVPKVRGVMGVWRLSTKGVASSIPNLRDIFDNMLENNGRVAGVIFDLSVVMAKSNKPGDASRYPVLYLTPNESRENLEMVRECRKPIMIESAK